ncbi:hypothetical protein B0T25DRAFT_592995 [Lasiosphaeria hispida]|uniref:non-specific serine/threonine protein kinase n=1 Tax=Lasiosphaeria hispida TaxID=260671 RepID=A0AAJ0HCH6_9PEZI|nr:hypothetical protein B0T25DRAFT_592995 [Lasiosphaeria hispida]
MHPRIQNTCDRASFSSTCEGASVSCSLDALEQLGQEDLQNVILDLLFALRNLPTNHLLRSKTGHGTLRNDLLQLNSAVIYSAVTESTPPPRLIASSLQQTPWLHNTSGSANSSEYCKDIDRVLRDELGAMYVGLPRFHEAFFGRVAGLEIVSEAIFKKCMEGSEPLFSNGWSGWPTDANQDHILSWFAERETGNIRKRAGKDSRCHWSHILVLGELKSNPSADIASKAWLDIRDAREVLAAQDTRRFVLGFTIYGLQFVSTVLGFLWMSEELGFDPTIMTSNYERFIEVERDGSTERLIIDEVMQRARWIAGRATTCWKAHREGHPQTPLVIQDSWQYPERDEEGECASTRHRGGLDVTTATNYRPERSMPPPSIIASASQGGRSNRAAGKKRSSSQISVPLSPSKRPRSSVSPTKAGGDALLNRVHRRAILRDYGKSIYKASSRSALLAALEGCIEGHESFRRKVGLLHRDISINNLMINEDDDNLSWPSFLIDLDLAVREQRDGASGAKGKTGTRTFMAIGALLGEQHSFVHDAESFFWVLFWICIHYDTQGKDIGPTEFDSWSYESGNKLVQSKVGTIGDESIFLKIAEENFTSYCQPLIPSVNRLRRKVFPNGERWKRLEPEIYSSMKEILREARKDPNVVADGR